MREGPPHDPEEEGEARADDVVEREEVGVQEGVRAVFLRAGEGGGGLVSVLSIATPEGLVWNACLPC